MVVLLILIAYIFSYQVIYAFHYPTTTFNFGSKLKQYDTSIKNVNIEKQDEEKFDKKRRIHFSTHLLSLAPKSPSCDKTISDLWKWKDVTLGDGRDYFLPRPRALLAMNKLLVGNTYQVEIEAHYCSQGEHEHEHEHEQEHDDSYNNNPKKEGEELLVDLYIINNNSRRVYRSINNQNNENATVVTLKINASIEECAVLSNCARMDVLLSVKMDIEYLPPSLNVRTADDNRSITIQDSDVIDGVLCPHNVELLGAEITKNVLAGCLSSQLESYQSKINNSNMLWEGISSLFDLPGMVVDPAGTAMPYSGKILQRQRNNQTSFSPQPQLSSQYDDIFLTIQKSLIHTSSLPNLITHVALVASGLQSRPSRPDRPIHFRPFSSRDSHILLQLKRVLEIVPPTYPRIRIILESALSAGKAARNSNIVPSLERLRGYDIGSKYSPSAPTILWKEVAEDVKVLAIKPSVERCITRLKALEGKDKIVEIQVKAEELMNKVLETHCFNDNDFTSTRTMMTHDEKKVSVIMSREKKIIKMQKIVKKMLHQPLMDIRKDSNKVNVEQVLEELRIMLVTELCI